MRVVQGGSRERVIAFGMAGLAALLVLVVINQPGDVQGRAPFPGHPLPSAMQDELTSLNERVGLGEAGGRPVQVARSQDVTVGPGVEADVTDDGVPDALFLASTDDPSAHGTRLLIVPGAKGGAYALERAAFSPLDLGSAGDLQLVELRVGNLDADGKPDLVLYGFDPRGDGFPRHGLDGTAVVLRSTDKSLRWRPVKTFIGTGSGGIFLQDISGDDRLEIVTADGAWDVLQLEQDLVAPSVITISDPDVHYTRMATIRLGRDRVLIARAGMDEQRFGTRLNLETPRGRKLVEGSFIHGRWPEALDVADLDGDGDEDLVLVTTEAVGDLWTINGLAYHLRNESREEFEEMLAPDDVWRWTVFEQRGGRLVQSHSFTLPVAPRYDQAGERWLRDVNGDGDADALLQDGYIKGADGTSFTWPKCGDGDARPCGAPKATPPAPEVPAERRRT